jgi:hypothetical protein
MWSRRDVHPLHRCQWRYLAKDLPPRSTVHDDLSLWNWDGTEAMIDRQGYCSRRGKGLRQGINTSAIDAAVAKVLAT